MLGTSPVGYDSDRTLDVYDILPLGTFQSIYSLFILAMLH